MTGRSRACWRWAQGFTGCHFRRCTAGFGPPASTSSQATTGPSVLIDSGWATTVARCLLDRSMQGRRRCLKDVSRFLLTHVHRDRSCCWAPTASPTTSSPPLASSIAGERDDWESPDDWLECEPLQAGLAAALRRPRCRMQGHVVSARRRTRSCSWVTTGCRRSAPQAVLRHPTPAASLRPRGGCRCHETWRDLLSNC